MGLLKRLLSVILLQMLIFILVVQHFYAVSFRKATYGHIQPILRSADNNRYRQTTRSHQVNDFPVTLDRNVERKKHLQEQCKTLSQPSKMKDISRHRLFRTDYVRILTNPDLSLYYCRVNKAASTHTFHTLTEIFNCSEECFQRSSERIRKLPYERKKKAIDGAYKFMFVREPYGRLFSTYCNKFYLPKGNWDPVGRDIVRRYRKNPSEDSLKFGHDVTFSELIRYTIENFEAGKQIDEHVRPMHTNCIPCNIDYDFIGKLETITSDWNYLAHEWRSRNITTSIPTHSGAKSGKVFDEMNHVLQTFKKVKDSKINVYDLYVRAWNYYQITSVISKHIGMPFSRSDNKTITYNLFLQKLMAARELSATNASELKAQKHEAILQAYSTVPLEDLERLKAVVKVDCLLFGYNVRPGWLFDRSTSNTKANTFNYFGGISGNKAITLI